MDRQSSRRSGAWTIFATLGGLLAVYSVYLIVLPSADPEHWRAFTTDPEMLRYLRDEFRSSGAVGLGFSIFAIVVAVRWFRAGDPWAWAVFWFYPLLFGWLAFTTWATGVWIFLLLVAVVALIISTPRSGSRAARTKAR